MDTYQGDMGDMGKRPLPPPSGRNIVKRQAQMLSSSGWEIVDDSEGLGMAKAHRELNRFRDDNSSTLSIQIKKRLFGAQLTTIPADLKVESAPSPGTRSTEGQIPGEVHQEEVRDALSPTPLMDKVQNTRPIFSSRQHTTAFCDEEDDEGYHSQSITPTNTTEAESDVGGYKGEAALAKDLSQLGQSQADEEDSEVLSTSFATSGLRLSICEEIPGIDLVVQDNESRERSEFLRHNQSRKRGAAWNDSSSSGTDTRSSSGSGDDPSDHDSSSGSYTEFEQSFHTYTEPHVDVDALLDQAQHYGRRQRARYGAVQRPLSSTRSYRARRNQNLLHPASRLAAEQYRTQNRHTDYSDPDFGKPRADPKAAEDRLRAFTTPDKSGAAPNARFVPTSQHRDFFDRGRPTRAERSHHSRLQARSLNGNSESYNNPDNNHGDIGTTEVNDNRLCTTSSGDGQFPSTLELLATQAGHQSACDRNGSSTGPSLLSSPSPRALTGPLRGLVKELPNRDLTLPRTFDSFTPEGQQITVDSERCKERKRDLDATMVAFREVARYAACVELTIDELDEVAEIRVFKDRVTEGYAMKLKRKRINDIKDNFKRRRQRYDVEPATEELVNRFYLDLIGNEDAEILQRELETVDTELQRLSALRAAQNEDRRNAGKVVKRQKRVHFSTDVEVLGGRETSRTQFARKKPKKAQKKWMGTPTQNRRDAQYKSLDERQALLQAKLSDFNNALNGRSMVNGSLLPIEDNEEPMPDNQSETSEEDDGMGYNYASTNGGFTGPPPTTSSSDSVALTMEELDDSEINRLENERQGIDAAIRAVTPGPEPSNRAEGAQEFDADLLRQMMERRRDNTTDRTIEEDSDASSDTSGTLDDVEDDGGPQPVHLYHIRAAFRNHTDHDADNEPEFQPFLSLKDAETALHQFLDKIQEAHKASARSIESKSSWNDRLLEKRLEIKFTDGAAVADPQTTDGLLDEMICRLWIEREIHEPTKREWRQQKWRKAATAKDVWVVQWEKTVTPVTEDGGGSAMEIDTQGATPDSTEVDARWSTPGEDSAPEVSADSVPLGARMEGDKEPAIVTASSTHIDNQNTLDDVSDLRPPGSDAILSPNDLDELFEDVNPSPPPHLPAGSEPEVTALSSQPQSQESRTPTLPVATTTTTTPTITTSTELLLYTSPILANTHASSILLSWYAEFYPGWHNLPYLRQIEDDLQAELDRLGSVGIFDREDSFVRVARAEEIGLGAGKGTRAGGESGNAGREAEERQVVERMRVWVGKVAVLGPGN